MHPRLQGDWGELAAALWLTGKGAVVSKPIGHCPGYDLIADFGDRIVRVEVKTTCSKTPYGRWSTAICTRGGNQSWSGMTKRFERDRCEFLFVLARDGRQWFIPADAVEAATALSLGGKKYAEYEVEPGPPIPNQTLQKATTTIASP